MAHASLETFESLIAPLSIKDFFAQYWDQKILFQKGNAARFSSLMSWEILNDLLGTEGVWNSSTLQLATRGQLIPSQAYCRPGIDRHNQSVMQPQREALLKKLRAGSTLVLNDMSGLTQPLRQLQHLLEETFGARVQANLYCSWENHQGFQSHFDTHDVMAFHIAGQKKWHLYEGRQDCPIAHPAFKNFGQAYHDQARGNIAHEILMEPGDFLYIPRGVYHDALADSPGSIHVTFGLTYPIGIDLITQLFEQAVHKPFFRKNIDRANSKSYLDRFKKELLSLIEEVKPSALTSLGYSVEGYKALKLPDDVSHKTYELTSDQFTLRRHQGVPILQGPGGQVPVPLDAEPLVSLLLRQKKITMDDIKIINKDAQGKDEHEQVHHHLEALEKMGVIHSV